MFVNVLHYAALPIVAQRHRQVRCICRKCVLFANRWPRRPTPHDGQPRPSYLRAVHRRHQTRWDRCRPPGWGACWLRAARASAGTQGVWRAELCCRTAPLLHDRCPWTDISGSGTGEGFGDPGPRQDRYRSPVAGQSWLGCQLNTSAKSGMDGSGFLARHGLSTPVLLWLPAGIVATEDGGTAAEPGAWFAMALQSVPALTVAAPCGLPLALGCWRQWRPGHRAAAWVSCVALIAVTETEALVGDGLVVKRVEPAHELGAPKQRALGQSRLSAPYVPRRRRPHPQDGALEGHPGVGRNAPRARNQVLDRATAAYQVTPTRKPTPCSASLSFALSRRVASSPSSNDVPPPEHSPSCQPRR